MKTCTTCGEEKGEDEFYPRAGKYKGTGATMNRCKGVSQCGVQEAPANARSQSHDADMEGRKPGESARA
jgi:hypothetical protein